MIPVARTGFPIYKYHAAQLASSQFRDEKSVLAYSSAAVGWCAAAVELNEDIVGRRWWWCGDKRGGRVRGKYI